MKLRIGYFYPDLLNLYGDNGNIEVLMSRAKERGINAECIEIKANTKITSDFMKQINIVFMGGGPDSSQKQVYDDLLKNKGDYLKEYIQNDGVGISICGSYQLLGHYYKSADGTIIPGLSIFDAYTQHFGNTKPRCIGNVVCNIVSVLEKDPVFKAVNKVGNTLVGFENHGGRTYLGEQMVPLAKVFTGHGNNSEDKSEGVLYKNFIGSYLHGPVLVRNPHLADYLIAKGLGVSALDELDDTLVNAAHEEGKKLPQ